jgi:HEAT repeat protein
MSRKARSGSTDARRSAPARPTSGAIRAELEAAQQLLDSDQRDRVEAGIQSLGLLGVEQTIDPLAARIDRGLPPELLELAITTLTALGQPRAGPVLYRLVQHRRPEIRRQAIEAIAATRPPDCEPVLLKLLSDEDVHVRSAAAVALGEVGTSRAVPRLFAALDHGNGDASPAIGKLVAPGGVRKLNLYLGKIGFHQLGPALGTVLQRRDVSERDKLELIARLEELGTPEVKAYLGELLAAAEPPMPAGVQRALARAVQQIAE